MNSGTIDEPNQLLSIIFDISKSSWLSLASHIPQRFQPYKDQIIAELYNQTISQLCIYINAYLLLNKENIIQVIVISDDSNSVITPLPRPTYKSAPTHVGLAASDSRAALNSASNQPRAHHGHGYSPTSFSLTIDQRSVVPSTAAGTESFGITTSEIISRLELLNPVLASLGSAASGAVEDTSTQSQRMEDGAVSPSNTNPNPNNTPASSPSSSSSSSRSATIFAGALTKALCFINKAQVHDVYVDRELPQHLRQTQLLSEPLVAPTTNIFHSTHGHGVSISPQAVGGTTATSPTMNSNQIQPILPIHPIVPSVSSEPCACEALQQASHLTHGQFLFISHRDMETVLHHIGLSVSHNTIIHQQQQEQNTSMSDSDPQQHQHSQRATNAVILPLLPLLLAHGLTSSSIRQHLVAPQLTSVALSAPCFCHKIPQSIGYVCSVCLTVCCREQAQCPQCKTRFIVRRPTNFAPPAPTTQASTAASTTATSTTATQPASSKAPRISISLGAVPRR